MLGLNVCTFPFDNLLTECMHAFFLSIMYALTFPFDNCLTNVAYIRQTIINFPFDIFFGRMYALAFPFQNFWWTNVCSCFSFWNFFGQCMHARFLLIICWPMYVRAFPFDNCLDENMHALFLLIICWSNVCAHFSFW